ARDVAGDVVAPDLGPAVVWARPGTGIARDVDVASDLRVEHDLQPASVAGQGHAAVDVVAGAVVVARVADEDEAARTGDVEVALLGRAAESEEAAVGDRRC